MRNLLLFVCILFSQLGWAQDVNRYMVFFTDKEGTIYSVEEPNKFLTERAIQRRKKSDIAVTEQDFPVNERYRQEVEAQGIAIFYQSRWLNAIMVEDYPDKVEALKSLPFVADVVYVAPGQRLNARLRAPAAPKALRQDVPDTQNKLLQIPLMHEQGYTGMGVLIAVLDNGFLGVNQLPQFSHLFDEKRVLRSWDFVRYSPDVFRFRDHGTRALSTIAVRDEGTFTGTAPDASFLLAITEDSGDESRPDTEYIIEEYNWLIASEWADSLGADIITSSLGYSTFDDPAMNYTFADMDGQTAVASRAAAWATERGMLVVSSAGNGRHSSWPGIGTPADADGTLAVGAIDAEGQLAPFSSGGPTADGRIKPEVVALGVNTIVVGANGTYQTNNGTSFSAPQIAGLAAGIWQAYPDLSNLQLRDLIMRSGDRAANPDNEYGWGLPTFRRIQSLVLSIEGDKDSGISIYPNPVQHSFLVIEFKTAEQPNEDIRLYILDATGRTLGIHQLLAQSNGRYELDVSGLTGGFYYLKIVVPGGQRVHKFIRQ
jgi:serine protease AprX